MANNQENDSIPEAVMNLISNPNYQNGNGSAGDGGGNGSGGPTSASSIIIARGFNGTGQERIVLHPSGPPSAPPPQGHQLSPVFVMPPPPPIPEPQMVQNVPPSRKTHHRNGGDRRSPSMPSFGGSLDNGLRSPHLTEKVRRTPMPIIGGK